MSGPPTARQGPPVRRPPAAPTRALVRRPRALPGRRVHAVPALAALALLLSLVVAPAIPAHAHARLVASQPTAGATIDTPPERILLEFNEAVEAEFGQLQVSGPDGTRLDLEPPTSSGVHVEAPVSPPTLPGTHTVAYRVVSGDGHPVEGTFAFEVAEAAVAAAQPGATAPPAPAPTPQEEATAAPAGEPSPAPTSSPGPTPSPTPAAIETEPAAAAAADEDGGLPLLPILVGAVLLVGVAGAVLARRGGEDDPAT